MGHIPERSCRICRTKKPKGELTRWTSSSAGWVHDQAGTVPGRGVYTCSPKCTEILLTKFGKK